jgi:spermidine synthase
MRIGVIGLGAGTTASYCGRGGYIRFYEINPQVIDVAGKYFSYIGNARKAGCTVDIIQGDGRASLEKEVGQGTKENFDIMVIDAFSDDSIPTHLLTSEATDLYLSQLSQGGVIAFHVSNAHLNLSAVLESMASSKHLYFNRVETADSIWVLLSKTSIGSKSYIPEIRNIKFRPWTDDYSNIIEVLKR